MLTHSNEKKYKCMKCGKSFRRKGSLSSHFLTHEQPEKQNCTCVVCGKRLPNIETLRKHMKTHKKTLEKIAESHLPAIVE